MPVFHTKTIESILEPVAQQVSKLIILHEEAEDGNAMPDLGRPVQVVKMAVDNLIKVGYETINNSEDQILKQDMPPALNRVEEASILLIQASEMLRSDPFSAPARKKLIEGSRGILQGTSALLLAFDESEVRKIIRICKNVLEYLAITEVVESMEDLVTFVKNLSPVLTRMTKDVDSREKELTHQVHREWLIRSLEQVKQLTPVLISGIKIYVTTKGQGGPGVQDAQNNRDFVTAKMSNEIHEIIRVLQLTTYDEEEWDADDITVMKKALNAIAGKMKQGTDWILDPMALPGSSGERALRQILDDALRIADCCSDPRDRESLNKAVGDINSMVDALAELRAQGKGNSPQALALARGIQQKLHELLDKCQEAVANTERSGVRKPAHTIAGKMDQAQKWLANPGQEDKGLGEEACRQIISEGRKIAGGLQGHKKAELHHMCDEAEIACNQLSDLCRKGMGNSPQARAVAANLSQKLHHLKRRMQDALVNQVADEFIDITTPLKQMSDAANAPFGAPNRDGNFAEKAHNFEATSSRLADTARQVATAGGCGNKRTIEGIQARAQTVNDLTPQLAKAAHIVLADPSNQASQEHFELLKKQWMDNMERLRGLVDEAVDTAAFIKATEEAILRDTERTEQAIKANDAAGVVHNTSSIARRANRVLQVAQQEAENSEDPSFVDRVNDSVRDLRATITPMVQNAKGVAQNPRDHLAGGRWRGANQQLIDAVGGVRHAVTGESPEDDHLGAFPPPPDMNQLHISEPEAQPGRVPSPPVPPPPPLLAEVPSIRALASIMTDSIKHGGPKSPDNGPIPHYHGPRGVYGQVYADQEKEALFKKKEPNIPVATEVEREREEPMIRPEVKAIVAAPPKPKPRVISRPAGPITLYNPEAQVELLPDQTLKIRDNLNSAPESVQGPARHKNGMFDIEISYSPPSVMPDHHGFLSPESPTEADDYGRYGAPPPVPPPPMMGGSSGYPYGDHAPPRPPLPHDTAPPRPPPPAETDDEEDMRVFPSAPQENQPIMQAAQDLYMDVRQWSSRDNEIISAAKRMALLMAKLSQLVRGEGGSKKDLIDCAKAIAEASEEVTRLAKELAKECTDKRMRMSLLQVCERIPTIGTQLKILSTVKATMLGAQGSEEDQEATEMLVGNAQNLMQSVRETVRAAEASSIKIRVDSGYSIRWARKRPWYT